MMSLTHKNRWPILGAAVLAVSALSVLAANTGMPTYKQRLAEHGYPTGLQDLDRWYPPVPDAENAALLYLKAVPPPARDKDGFEVPDDAFETIDFDLLPIIGNAELPPPGEAVPAEMEATMREFLALNAEALDLLYAGAELKRARFHADWDEFGSFLNYLSPLRHALRMLKLDALRHVLDQNAGEATHSLVAAIEVAESLAADPSITSNLVFHGLAGIALSGYEEVLSRMNLSPGQLEQLQDALKRPSLTTLSAMEHAVAGEAAFLEGPEDILVRASRQNVPSPFIHATGWTLFAALRLAGVRAFTDLADGRTLIEVLGMAHLPSAQIAESLRPHETEESPLAVRPEPDEDVTRAAFSQYYSQGYMYEGFYRGALLTMATTALAQAALAVERYERATGEWPERIDAVVPEYLDAVPEDPFTGAPIRFRKTDTGYLLYSAGWNCRDDGGIPPPEGKGWWGGGDVLFEVRTEGRSWAGRPPREDAATAAQSGQGHA